MRRAVLGVTLALAVSGCGSDAGGEIPAQEADQLLTALDQVQDASAQNQCEPARAAAESFASEVASANVGDAVSAQLLEGADQIQSLVASEVCVDTGATGATPDDGITETTTTEQPADHSDEATKPPDEPEPEPAPEPEPEPEPEPPAEEPTPPSEPPGDGTGNPDGGTGAPTGGTGARGGGK